MGGKVYNTQASELNGNVPCSGFMSIAQCTEDQEETLVLWKQTETGGSENDESVLTKTTVTDRRRTVLVNQEVTAPLKVRKWNMDDPMGWQYIKSILSMKI